MQLRKESHCIVLETLGVPLFDRKTSPSSSRFQVLYLGRPKIVEEGHVVLCHKVRDTHQEPETRLYNASQPTRL